ncbi:ANK-REP-REGION domain-containing protein [Mycena venus]|uniref:ANK-REP-REGION domain-containing protein n=1 Tax=Mycena venus TaxID=2733690 RepID=A0A8H7D847_9AGAR|nr:ANK-REP-REGION domain-containing protein [Mycena venus]
MAEALGTVASILQLFDTALRIRERIQDFRNAPQEQQKLLSEMDNLRLLLQELQPRIAGNLSNPNLQNMKSPLADFEAAMKKLVRKLNPVDGRFAKLWKQLKWSLEEKKEAQETLRKFGDFKLLLNSWLVIDLWDIGQQHGHDTAEQFSDATKQRERNHTAVTNSMGTLNAGVTTIVDRISEQQRQINSVGHSVDDMANKVDVVNTGVVHISDMQERERQEKERMQIIDWLSPINFFLRHADISRVRQQDTGGWLLADTVFKRWESGSGRTIWCRGIPGAGKTVLVSKVVDHLTVESENEGETDTQTPVNLLSGLWRQLVLGRDLGPLAKKLYQQHREKGTTPSLDQVLDMLNYVIERYSKVYIVIDAIDEYPEAPRLILLQRLTAMSPGVNLMIMSRPHIVPQLSSFPILETLDIRLTEGDLQTYVDAQIDSSPRLSKHVHKQPSLREDIHFQINNHTVDGMFLLAKLHMESLTAKNTIAAVREALTNLPKSLRDSYEIAMERIQSQNEEDRKTAHSALTWVANAKRPLTISEITMALAIEPGAQCLDKDNVLDIEIILAVCAGLVIVDEKLSVVRLVHYTTQEYLDSLQAERFPDAQTEITRTLLTFLAFDGFPHLSWSNWDTSPSPLVGYSQYCLAHAAGKPEGPLRNMIVEFLGRAPPQPSALWIAAAANLLETVKFLLEEAPMNKFLNGSGISIASYYGHLQMVKLLVENGADMNGREDHWPPLTAASQVGHDTIVQFLLENGVDVNACGRYHGCALHVALVNNHEKIARMIIEHGADVNLQGEQGGALTMASWYGMENIVALLLEHGADINARGGQFDFALHTALVNKHEKIARLLIENGADVNLQGEHGGALMVALWCGMENIVVLLLERGADINMRGGQFDFALHTALVTKQENIAQLLIRSGADVNLQSKHGGALTVASWYGMENIVCLLLERGAEVNTRGGQYDFALHAALANKQERVARLLIENGADVNIQGVYGAALTTAVWYGMENIVCLLLQQGAVVNAHGGQYDFALHTALARKHERITQLLIENGADINLQGKHGGALTTASWYGAENIVRLLLQNGAEVNARGGRCEFALHAALINRHRKIVHLLIENGANVNALGRKLCCPLGLAADWGDENLVRLLIDNSADPNANGGAALWSALRNGRETAVRLLLEYGADANLQDKKYGVCSAGTIRPGLQSYRPVTAQARGKGHLVWDPS